VRRSGWRRTPDEATAHSLLSAYVRTNGVRTNVLKSKLCAFGKMHAKSVVGRVQSISEKQTVVMQPFNNVLEALHAALMSPQLSNRAWMFNNIPGSRAPTSIN
jgi:hypothetical protein